MGAPLGDFGYDPASLTWQWVNALRRNQTTDFSKEYELIGDRAIALLNATKRLCQSAAGSTIHNRLTGVRACVAAIAKFAPKSDRVVEWAHALVTSLTSDEKKTESTRWNTFNWAIGVLMETARVRGEQFYLRNPFTRTRGEREIPGDELRAAIRRQSKSDIIAYLRDLQQPPPEHVAFVLQARALAAKNGGLLPSLSVGLGYRLRDSWFRSTRLPIQRLTRYLYPAPEDLVPFLLLITEALAGNPDSVALIRRDALQPFVHPAYGECFKLKMEKPRAGDIEPYLLRGQSSMSVGALIRRVLDITAPLVPHAGKLNSNFAFLAFATSGKVRPMLGSLRMSAVKRYLRDRGLPYMRLRSLRVSRAVSEYRESKDYFRVKHLLRQSDVAVTIQYLDDATLVDVDAATIADIQQAILSPAPPKNKAAKPSKTGNVQLPSHTCLDPSDETKELDEHGACAALLFPFNDRSFVFDYNPRSVAFVLREYIGLCEAQQNLVAERFVRIYGRRKEFIEAEVLSNIDDKLRSEAETLLASLPPLPYID